MSDKEILKAAIEKANSSDYPMTWGWPTNSSSMDRIIEERSQYLMFNHEFAKAFWGEEMVDLTPIVSKYKGRWISSPQKMVAWKWHLQQMIIKENPIKYLAKFL